MTDQLITELIEALKTIAPEVWATLLRQVYITTIQYAVWAAIAAVSGGILLTFFIRMHRDSTVLGNLDEIDRAIIKWVAFLLATISLVLTTGWLNGVIGRLLNPEFYVIRYLLEQIN